VIQAKEGQTVKAEQILLELESEIPRTELQQAQAKLEGQLNRGAELIAVQNQDCCPHSATAKLSQESEQLAQLDQIRQRLNSSRAYALEKTA